MKEYLQKEKTCCNRGYKLWPLFGYQDRKEFEDKINNLERKEIIKAATVYKPQTLAKIINDAREIHNINI